MNQFRSFRSLAAGVIATAALAAVSGCSSGPDAKATVDKMGAFGNEVAKVKDSIDHALGALTALVGAEGGDIKARSDAYSSSVDALDGQAQVVRDRAEQMKASGDTFFKEREGSTTVSPERRAQLTACYARIKEDMAVAKEQFTPFLKSLKDIRSYLGLDLSPAGVASVGSLMDQAKANGASVKAHIDSVLVQLNSVRGMLSTKP